MVVAVIRISNEVCFERRPEFLICFALMVGIGMDTFYVRDVRGISEVLARSATEERCKKRMAQGQVVKAIVRGGEEQDNLWGRGRSNFRTIF